MIFLTEDKKMEKKVKKYIQDIVGINYGELKDLESKLCKLREDNCSYPFYAYKIIQTDGNSYSNAWTDIYDSYYGSIFFLESPTYISEYYIKRKRFIDDLFKTVKLGDKKYDEIVFAEYLDKIIYNELISLETLWCMEFKLDDNFIFFTKDDKLVLEYYVFFVYLFLQYTNDICKEHFEIDSNNEIEIIDYQEKIDSMLVDFFGKKVKNKHKKYK